MLTVNAKLPSASVPSALIGPWAYVLQPELYSKLSQREVGELRNEVAELRHAIEQVGECDYRAECPVLKRLQRTAKRPVSRFKIQVPSL